MSYIIYNVGHGHEDSFILYTYLDRNSKKKPLKSF